MAAMTNTLLWTNEPDAYLRALKEAGHAARLQLGTLRMDQAPSPEQLAQTEVMLAMNVPPGTLAKMPKLRWIQALTVGIDNWLARADLRESIALTCARGSHRVAMPENILGALFHLTKPYAQATIDQKDHRWVRHVSAPLAGKTLGILGLGTIGQELAKKAAALELRVIGTKRSPAAMANVERVYGPDEIDAVLGQSDFVLLLLPLTPQTDSLMNAERLKKMRPTAYLLNFGRGALVADDDLVAAVKAKTIAGAVLDVYRTEPLPAGHPFWGTAGITVMPHVGGLAAGRDEIVAGIFADNVRRFLNDEPLNALVERARGY
ncbi:MAG: D-2-hydroxyacid dehydrogenase [Proteobacteria bacterium]|nr:D-2-hydroxyacid dehydrogenase [Pseudomonadota bacterium]